MHPWTASMEEEEDAAMPPASYAPTDIVYSDAHAVLTVFDHV